MTGGVSCVGDEMARTALYEAANAVLSRVTRFSALKRWGMDVAKRRGTKRAKVALARKIGVDSASDVDGRHEFPLDEGGVEGAARRATPDRTRKRFRSGPEQEPLHPRSRRRDDGAGEAVSTRSGRHQTDHASLDRLAVSSDGMMWRPCASTTDGSKRPAAKTTETDSRAPRSLRRNDGRARAARRRLEKLIRGT